MFEAVMHIGQEQLLIGKQRDCQRMVAFASMVLGELISQEYLDDPTQTAQGLEYLTQAAELYKNNTEVLSQEEYSRVNLGLSTLYRHKGDQVQSKRYLEMAKDKVTDKKVLLQFY